MIWMQYEEHILFGNMGQVLAASAVQMYGDYYQLNQIADITNITTF
jgi:hypothetical protein